MCPFFITHSYAALSVLICYNPIRGLYGISVFYYDNEYYNYHCFGKDGAKSLLVSCLASVQTFDDFFISCFASLQFSFVLCLISERGCHFKILPIFCVILEEIKNIL